MTVLPGLSAPRQERHPGRGVRPSPTKSAVDPGGCFASVSVLSGNMDNTFTDKA